MNFEIDPLKSKSNKNKHGIDFIDAQALWNDPDLIEIPAKTTAEIKDHVEYQIKDGALITLKNGIEIKAFGGIL